MCEPTTKINWGCSDLAANLLHVVTRYVSKSASGADEEQHGVTAASEEYTAGAGLPVVYGASSIDGKAGGSSRHGDPNAVLKIKVIPAR